jgi:hypothetical protein
LYEIMKDTQKDKIEVSVEGTASWLSEPLTYINFREESRDRVASMELDPKKVRKLRKLLKRALREMEASR